MIGGPRVDIVIVNWNGWADTVECLESAFRSDYPEYRVIVCDNASSDGSVERIAAWADGRLEAPVPPGSRLRHLSLPPVPKPIPFVVEKPSAGEAPPRNREVVRLRLIASPLNLGFAGGNNLALRSSLGENDLEYVWLLNNDTVVEADALRQLVSRMRDRPDAGMCGSTLRFYDQPEAVQAYGGATYNRWFGLPRNISRLRAGDDVARIESRLAFVMGASMLVSKAFLLDVGLMSEDYFLYFEELDWATRAFGRYRLAYAPESRVYHKGGRSTGLSPESYDRIGDFHFNRSQLIYARRYTPWLMPFIFLRQLLGLGKSVIRWRLERFGILVRIYGDLIRGRYRPRRGP